MSTPPNDDEKSSDFAGGPAKSPMLTKFESKSARVKGLSFHPTRTWILAALHNGEIQLWDYIMATLIHRFNDHEGPVRGINFHRSQPIFVSGGDDYLIKVWDYKVRRCLFTLQGHLDYIRTVEFHLENPWIVSASDDQTVRIWNWQSREGISVLTGHNHYCMSASFHPKEDLVVSASLDQTVRVWDTSGLRKKTVRGPADIPTSGGGGGSHGSGMGSDGSGGGGGGKADFLNNASDAVVKFVLEGHERGVNWAIFHPTQPLIATAADDRQVKLWRMNDSKAWQVGPMRGHTNNVSSVAFHPTAEFVLSDSEDRTIRVWDLNKRTCLKTFRRDQDRFWIITGHPSRSLMAAGHDTGMLVFKLERERPAYDVYGPNLYRCKDGYIRMSNDSQSLDVQLVSYTRPDEASAGIRSLLHPNTLQVNRMNQESVDVLICGPGSTVEIVCFPPAGQKKEPQQRIAPGVGAVFTARNRYAVLEDGHQITIKNFSNEITKRIATPQANSDGIFPGGLAGREILRAEDRITLFDIQGQRVIHEVSASKIKSVIWAEDSSFVCLLSKRHVVICDKDLEHCCTVSESVRIKSATWTKSGVLIYATLKHVKYMIPNGDVGVLRSLNEPVYLTRVEGDTLYCIDRDQRLLTLKVDTAECNFKVALAQGRFKEVMHMIENAGMCGEVIVGYLEDKGYPEVALHFVEDDATRFTLAMECGQLQVAKECADKLQNEDAWRALAAVALKLGDVALAELCMQRTRDLPRLSFLYLVTGNLDNLSKMQVIAERHKDADSRMQNALMRGDAKERVKVLESVGQLALAYVCAKTNGIEDEAARLATRLQEANVPLPPVSAVTPLAPPVPLYQAESRNWPLMAVQRGELERAAEALRAHPHEHNASTVAREDDIFDDGPNPMAAAPVEEMWDDDELDLGDEPIVEPPPKPAGGRGAATVKDDEPAVELTFATVERGQPVTVQWVANSTCAADHVAAGSFETAMRLLNRQVGVINFAPLKPLFMDVFGCNRVQVPGPALMPARDVYLLRAGELPLPCFTLRSVQVPLATGYDLFGRAKFDDALVVFQKVLHTIPLVVCAGTDEQLVLLEALAYAREYVIACQLRRAVDAEGLPDQRATELSAYMTRRDLQPTHLMLVVKAAMVKAFKLENYITAAAFARRLLAMNGIDAEKNAKLKTDAQKVLQRSEREGRNAVELRYHDGAFDLDAVSHVPIAPGASKKCPFCSSKSASAGKLCPVCELSPFGVETLGLVSMTRTGAKGGE